MTQPAYGGADEGRPPPRRPDPRVPSWAAAQEAMVTAAESNKLAVAELAARPGDVNALEMVRLTIRVLEELGGALRYLAFDEAIMAEERAAGFREGYAACKADRCRMHVVNDQGTPGPH